MITMEVADYIKLSANAKIALAQSGQNIEFIVTQDTIPVIARYVYDSCCREQYLVKLVEQISTEIIHRNNDKKV